MASEKETPGQARETGGSEGTEIVTSVAKRKSDAGRVDERDERRESIRWVSRVEEGGKVIPGGGRKPMDEEEVLNIGEKAGKDRGGQP